MSLSRRSLLKASAALGAAAALKPNLSFAQAAPTEKTSVVIIHLDGGYNSLFGSADSFVPGGTFGCTGSNTLALANGLVVDAPTFGTMPQAALNKMASVGVRHGLTAHDAADMAIWSTGVLAPSSDRLRCSSCSSSSSSTTSERS